MKLISDEEIEIIRRCLRVRDILGIYKILNGLSDAPIEKPIIEVKNGTEE